MDIQEFRLTLGQHPLAYFSAEFALDDRLPIYSGGLGVLAGDMVRQANDANLPFVAVGLLYHEGYFEQHISVKAGQTEQYPRLHLPDAPIQLVVDTAGEPIIVTIPIKDQIVSIQIWEYLQGDVSVYLLDTNLPANTPENRLITWRLYGGDRETRLLQEIVLGIGGARALLQLHIHPSIYHLNEGHSALAVFEITHHYMIEYNMTFQQAYEYARQKIVFTNHTLVPAGNEVFDPQLVSDHLTAYAKSLDLPITAIISRGTSPRETAKSDHQFSLTRLALNMACRVNTVSKLHSVMAKQLWPDMPMPAITNGVHLPRWVNADLKAQAPNFDIQALAVLSAEEVWRLHSMAKQRLVDEVQFLTGVSLNPAYCTISWARRFASYKRPGLLFQDTARLQAILQNTTRPVQIIIAGKAHPHDWEGRDTLHLVLDMIEQLHLTAQVVFVPNYNLTIAELLVAGSDVWLNTPIRGTEASGTSGMKAGANGGLQCSVSDGWVDEVDLAGIGWVIDPEQSAESLYTLLEQDIIPLYYKRTTDAATGIPTEWINRMKQTMTLIWSEFSAERMLGEYIEVLYRPALELENKDKHEHNWRRNYRTISVQE